MVFWQWKNITIERLTKLFGKQTREQWFNMAECGVPKSSIMNLYLMCPWFYIWCGNFSVSKICTLISSYSWFKPCKKYRFFLFQWFHHVWQHFFHTSSNFGTNLVWSTTHSKFRDILIKKTMIGIKHPAFNVLIGNKIFFERECYLSHSKFL